MGTIRVPSDQRLGKAEDLRRRAIEARGMAKGRGLTGTEREVLLRYATELDLEAESLIKAVTHRMLAGESKETRLRG